MVISERFKGLGKNQRTGKTQNNLQSLFVGHLAILSKEFRYKFANPVTTPIIPHKCLLCKDFAGGIAEQRRTALHHFSLKIYLKRYASL
jgi:hypothetical protein